ncbi:MAG: alpha-amylase family glycosyl hydrolase, partial [Nannocystaceae bacterium]
DPEQARRTYVEGTENSAILVPDCSLPSFEVTESVTARPAPGNGTLTATLTYRDSVAGTGPQPSGYTLELDNEGSIAALGQNDYTINPETGDVALNLVGLSDGKYTVRATAASADGSESDLARVVFWIEAEAFSWRDALVYMVLTDRFRDGDPGNNPGPTPMADPRGDYQGGDLEGVRQAIADGTLDQLGIRAIWLTPFQQNPEGAYIAADNQHYVTGYHGYWPTKAREVDTRLGGAEALHALVAEAHEHGIRVLQDFVVNHVHEDHEYMQAHPDWFRTGCVCGTQDCDWTGHALDCMFAGYLPDINHTVPAATEAFVDDAVWWLDTFNLDGLRVDAVKHVEEVATRNLSAAVAEGFEAAGTHYFLMGETAMGWSDCADPCNDENYETIARYIGPHGLDGQFDFVLYHATAYNTFAYGDKGMLHAAYWLEHGLEKWPSDAIMTPYIGSHDTPRFATLADYRGQDPGHDRGVAHNQWDNTAEAPGDDEPYWRTRVAMAWLLGLPGAPLLYYGDEYGQWGGADPNNRLMWRPEDELSAVELETLQFIRTLGKARQELEPLRRGTYVPLTASEDALVYGRMVEPGQAAIVGINRSGQPANLDVEV